jgi:hypothetical protein
MLVSAQDADLVNYKWDRKAFYANTIKSDRDEVGWRIWRNAKPGLLKDAKALLDEFEKEPETFRENGLAVISYSYAVPYTIEESKNMQPHIKRLHQDAEWKQVETDLFNKLIAECEARKVRLLVNTSMDMKKQWKVLVDPK